MVDLGQTVALVIAQEPGPPAGKEEFGKASPVGLVVILLLGLATVLLIRSMTKHLRRVPPSFDPPPGQPGPTGRPADAPPERDLPRATDVEASPDR